MVIFLGEPELAGFIEAKVVEVVVTTGAIRRAKLQSNDHHQQTNTQCFTGRMPFLSPNRVRALIFQGLAHPKLAWGLSTLSLTTRGSGYLGGGLPCP